MTTFLILICGGVWLLALLPLLGALVATLASTAGAKIAGKKGADIPYYAHLTIFPVIIVAVIGAWITHFSGVDNAFLWLLLPLVNVAVFIGGMLYVNSQ